MEIDHIVSLELGGSNDIANLYPEKAKLSASAPGFHVKDKLENKLHDLVCDGTMTLRSVQRQIAGNATHLPLARWRCALLLMLALFARELSLLPVVSPAPL